MIRWHTDPQVPPPTPKEKELSDIVDSNSYGPLYLNIQSKINNPIGLDDEDLAWLKSIENAFDHYVTQILNAIRLEPWDYEHRIRDEYTKIYGQPLPWDVSIRTVIGRLLTYKEIWSYQREAEAKNIQRQCSGTDWFWRRPEPKPIWNVGCLSFPTPPGSGMTPFLTGINPKNRRQVYHVTYQRPWGLEIDPAHHWGVFIDQTRSYNSDAPIRVLMACCGEHVGATEGCWIALPDDKGAVEGVIKPYEVYVDVFDTIWTDISNNSPLPSAEAISESFRIGTAFQDVEKYDALHRRIKTSLQNAAPVIRNAYEVYQTKLQTTLDTLDEAGDAKRDTNPFESILTKEQQEIVSLPIRLKQEFNAIQCVDTRSEPPALKDYINERVFRVQDMLKEFTFEKMGGIEIYSNVIPTKTDRIKMLSTTKMETIDVLNKMIQKVDAAGGDLRLLQFNRIKNVAEAIIYRISLLNSRMEKRRRQRVQSLLEMYRMGGSKAEIPPLFVAKWNELIGTLDVIDKLPSLIIEKQREINKCLISLRSKNQDDWKSPNMNLPFLETLTLTLSEQKDEILFEENINFLLVIQEIGKLPKTNTIPQKGDVTDGLSIIYNSILKTYDNAIAYAIDPVLPSSPISKVKESEMVANATRYFYSDWREISKDLEDEKDKLRQIAQAIRFIDANAKDTVKPKILASGDFQAKIDKISEIVYELYVKKNDALDEFRNKLRKAEENYKKKQDELKKSALNALITLETVLTDDPKMIMTYTEVNDELEKIMRATAPLKLVDEWVQYYLAFNDRLDDIYSKRATSDKDFDTEQIKSDYVVKWTTNGGLVDAAKRLSEALGTLLGNLQSIDNAKAVDVILTQAKTRATEAFNLISVDARNARLERERRKKEEIDNDREGFARPLFDWLKNPIVSQSTLPLQILNALESKYAFQKGPSGQIYSEKIREGKLWDNYSEIYSAFTKIPNFLRPSRDLSGDGLPAALNDNTFITSPQIGETQVFNALYVQNYDITSLVNVYRLYAEYLVKEMYIDDQERENLKNMLLLGLTTLALLPDQPLFVRVVPNPNDTFDVSSSKRPAPPMVPGSSVFTWTTQDWIANSCWIDSAIISLFSVPQTTWVKNLFSVDRVMNNGFELIFNDTSKNIIVTKTQSECDPKDVIDFHSSLLEDITFLQQPSGTNYTCKTRTRMSSARGCLKRYSVEQTEKEGDQETPATFYDSFVYLYGKERLGMEYVIHNWEDHGNIVRVRNPMNTTKSYIIDVSSNLQSDVIKTLGAVNSFSIVPILFDNFQLASVVVKSGEDVLSGHFTTFLYDFASKRWAFFNIGTNAKQIGWVDNLSKDTDVYGVPRETPLIDNIGLPVGVFNFEGIKSRGVFYGYKPAFFVFIKKDEIDQMLVNLAAANVKIVTPPKISPSNSFSMPEEALGKDEPTLKDLFERTKKEAGWLTDAQKAAVWLNGDWELMSARIRNLVAEPLRLEGLLYAWYIVRTQPENRQRRFAVGATRADVEQFTPPTPIIVTPPPPPPPTSIVTPPPPPAPIISELPPILSDLVPDLYQPLPTTKKEVIDAYESTKGKLKINISASEMENILSDSFRLTGLLHAMLGQNQRSIVRGLNMAAIKKSTL